MKVVRHRHIFRGYFLTLIGVCLSLYFSYHAIFGERSYTELKYLNHQLSAQQEIYKDLLYKRQVLQNSVMRLRAGSLDLDLLEERARHVLGYAYAEDMIIMEHF